MPRKRTEPVRARTAAPAGSAAPNEPADPTCPHGSAPRIKVQVRYYQRIREIAGGQVETHLVDPESTVSDLLAAVIARHPGIVEFSPSLLVAVNATYAERNALLAEGDVVDFMPPVSGG